jgi:hypothetical protein
MKLVAGEAFEPVGTISSGHFPISRPTLPQVSVTAGYTPMLSISEASLGFSI